VEHEPVLLSSVVEFLVPPLERGGVFVDATLGRGGHARAVLEAAPSATLVGIDRDPEAVEASRSYLAPFAERIRIVRGDFKGLATLLERLGVAPVRGVLLDLGVSSPQLDDPGRGFGYRQQGPLDMRMDPGQTFSAHDVVNSYDERELARVIRTYGEERYARRIARGIVRARPVDDTAKLADVVRDAIPAPARRTGGHPARRTFQAIRIETNREMDALRAVMPAAVEALDAGGRIVVIAYHSLEDRLVKRTFSELSRDCTCPPDLPICACGAEATLRVLTPRPVTPGDEEVQRNPRSRAAKLRAAEKLKAARPVPDETSGEEAA
jgi:16S rRNA (cytosine1402-N4)-methyltransferase